MYTVYFYWLAISVEDISGHLQFWLEKGFLSWWVTGWPVAVKSTRLASKTSKYSKVATYHDIQDPIWSADLPRSSLQLFFCKDNFFEQEFVNRQYDITSIKLEVIVVSQLRILWAPRWNILCVHKIFVLGAHEHMRQRLLEIGSQRKGPWEHLVGKRRLRLGNKSPSKGRATRLAQPGLGH